MMDIRNISLKPLNSPVSHILVADSLFTFIYVLKFIIKIITSVFSSLSSYLFSIFVIIILW